MSHFKSIVEQVAKLKPGGRLAIDQHILNKGWGGMDAGIFSALSGFTPQDRVLENIIGSGARCGHKQLVNCQIEFFRLYASLPEHIYSYVSPDRTHYYTKRADGLWQHREFETSPKDEVLIQCSLHGHRWIQIKVMPRIEAPTLLDVDCSIDAVVELVDGQECARCRERPRENRSSADIL